MPAPLSDDAPFSGQKELEEMARLAAIEKWCNHVEKTIDNPNIIQMIEEFVIPPLIWQSSLPSSRRSVHDLFLFDRAVLRSRLRCVVLIPTDEERRRSPRLARMAGLPLRRVSE